MYRLIPSAKFERKARKLLKNNPRLKRGFDKTIKQLTADPFYPGLKSHRVDIAGDKPFSSSVTGDLRIVWEFSQNQVNVIDLLDIGGHSGSKKVYR